MLDFNPKWRKQPPPDTQWVKEKVPAGAISDFYNFVVNLSLGTGQWKILEYFKKAFCVGRGEPYVRSSTLDWAETDLEKNMRDSSGNLPLFLEAFWVGVESLESLLPDSQYVPDANDVNEICLENRIGYEIDPPYLQQREEVDPQIFKKWCLKALQGGEGQLG